MEAPEVDRRVAEISVQLRELGDALDNDPRLHEIISNLAHESYVGRQYTLFTSLIRQFVFLVAHSTNIPPNMVDRIIRIFLLMWNNQELSGRLLQAMYPGTSLDTHETPVETQVSEMSVDIPQEVKLMDDEFIRQYLEVLNTGEQKVKSIRLMVVGMFGVGKTSLVENLIKKAEISQKRVIESTVGIDVTHCDIRDGKWIENIFDTDASEKFLEVMSASDSPESPIDSVDAGRRTFTDNTAGKPIGDENEKTAIYDIALEQGENNSQETSAGKEDYDRNIETLKKKLTDSDDPELSSFMRKILNSANEPHSPLQPTVSLWDFAGQYIYYSTHHFFLNSRSVYLLLMNISKPLDSLVEEASDFPLSGFLHKDFTCLEAFKFWLNSIHMYSTQQVQEVKPSVILVGTHKDVLQGTDKEKERLKEDYFEEALKSFNGSPVLDHIYRKKFLINNLDKEENFGKLREEVLNLAKKQEYWDETQPARWISLERTFLGLRSEGKEIISFDEVKNADKKCEIPIESEEGLRVFLQFQHSLGSILYYKTDMLQDYVILSPQWIIDAFRCFITHVPDKNPKQLLLWENFERNAILTPELIDEIIDHNEKNKYFRDYKKQVIEYMEHLDMLAKPADTVEHVSEENRSLKLDQQNRQNVSESFGETSDADLETDFAAPSTRAKHLDLQSPYNQTLVGQDTNKSIGPNTTDQYMNTEANANFYIVPSLLKSRPQESEISELINPSCKEKTPILCMVFQDGFMPPSVFHRLLAVCIRKWKTVEQNKQCLLFNGFAAFYVCPTKTSTLSLWFHDNIIYARVSFYSRVEQLLAQKIRLFLVQSLTDILTILPKESRIIEIRPFEEYIQCACVSGFKPGEGLLKMKDFLYFDTVMCNHSKLHAVSKSEGIGLWCYDSVKKQKSTVIPLTVLKRQPTVKELGRVARGIGDEYSHLGKELGLKPSRLQQIVHDHRSHLATAIYQMLYISNCQRHTVEQLRNKLLAVDSDVESFDKAFVEEFEQHYELRYCEGKDYSRKPTDAQLASLVDGIGNEYWLLGIELGIPEIEMEQLDLDHRLFGTKVYKMLCNWNKGDTCIEDLGKAMLMVGANMDKFYEIF